MSATDALAVLRKVPLFAPLDADEVREVISRTSVVNVDPGAEIFSDGAAGDAMYVVIVGEVEIVKPIPTGGTRVLSTLGSRAVFGEMSLLGDETRSAGARARSKSSLLKIGRDDFRERLARADLVALKMAAQLAKVVAARLRTMDDEIVRLVADSSGSDQGPESAPEEGGTRGANSPTTALHDIAKAREWVMMQWKL